MRLIFIGPPGVGKGTQASNISAHYEIVHLSSGDLLREEISLNSVIGKEAKSFIDQGMLVPDHVLLKMMENRLSMNDCTRGFLLDGFPRTIPQAEGLDKIMGNLNQIFDAVVSIEADENELVKRLVNRGKTSGRSDDNPEVIRKRLQVYKNQTEPLIKYYRKKKLIKTVNGIGSIAEITARIIKVLN